MNLRTSAMARLGVMALLLIALIIPLAMVQSVVTERASRRDSVVREVSGTWGGAQTITGPVLTVPYRYRLTDSVGRLQEIVERAMFLPEALDVTGDVKPDVRQRTLFKVVVYRAHLQLSGRFVRPDLSKIRPVPVQPLWDQATLSLGIADPRGIANRTTITWNGKEVPFVPGAEDVGLFTSGLHAAAGGLEEAPPDTPLGFSVTLDINGTRDLRIVPVGSDTSAQLTSTWPHPSFVGKPPEPRRVEATGFAASWNVPYFGRGYPPHWTTAGLERDKLRADADQSAFGVSLIQPVDIYQQAERAIKYAALIIVMTFAVFFLWETVRSRLLHPIQYLFVGFAMCVFYLLLVSISEHLGFDIAYGTAASATILLISMYSIYVLGGVKEGTMMGSGLTALYGFLYMLLRLEDYALLAGSLGLFLMLALLMFATRRVNWYDLRLGAGQGDAAA